MGETLKPIAIVLTVVDYNMPDANLSWTDMQTQLGSDFNVAYYYLYKQTKFGQKWTRIAQIDGETEIYADTAVVDGGTYRYYVSAVITGIGECAESNVVELTMVTPGLSEIYIVDQLGGYVGRYAIGSDSTLTAAPGVGDYYYDVDDFPANVPCVSAFVENGFLHTGGFNSRAYWWVTKLSDLTRVKIWNFTAGPNPPSSCYRTGTDPVTSDVGAGVWVTRHYDAARTNLVSYELFGPVGGTGDGENNCRGKHAVDSAGRAYWNAAGSISRATVFPLGLNDGAVIDAQIGTIDGMIYAQSPIALYQDGAYVVTVQTDSSTATREGCWVHVIKISTGAVTSIDLNTTANTYDNEHVALSVSIMGALAFVTRGDGGYDDGVTGTRRLVFIIDLTDPDNPTLASTITTSINGLTYVRRVVGYGNYIYFCMTRYWQNELIAVYSTRWLVYDLSDPTSPVNLADQAIPVDGIPVFTFTDAWCFTTQDEAIDGGDKGQVVL